MAAAFCITAVLKQIFPNHIGFYVGEHGLNLASPAPQGQDLLGPHYAIVALVLGLLIIVLTSFIVRIMMRKFAKLRSLLT